jgi:hypothetical protein
MKMSKSGDKNIWKERFKRSLEVISERVAEKP